MTIAAFMAMALHDPEAGYYARRQPLGADGDFITAPEISQIFGELIGAACADFWRRMGCPNPVVVTEMGPGRGTLMADFLRAAATVLEFRAAIRLKGSDLHLRVDCQPAVRLRNRRWRISSCLTASKWWSSRITAPPS